MTKFASRIENGFRRRWTHARNDRAIIKMAKEVAQHVPATQLRPVIFFNVSTRLSGVSLNAAFSMLAGWSLRLSGVPVVHYACRSGLSRCVLGTDRTNPGSLPPCKACIAQSKVVFHGGEVRWFDYQEDTNLAKALGNLALDTLSKFEYQGAPLGKLALPSLRWILRRHHLDDDEPTRQLYRQYLLSAWGVVRTFNALLEELNPQAVVVFNGMFYPEAAVRWAAQQRGLPVITHEVGLRPFTGFFTPGEATAYPIHIPDDFELLPAQNERLDSYLVQRFQGNFTMAGVRFWPEMQSLSPEFWQRAETFRQVVPVFTNVIFDTSQGHANVVFEHMFAWLDLVLELIKSHPETFFVIRAHPDECRPGKESLESVADWARRNSVRDMPNVLFVDSGEYFSSYELIQRSKFVMVYNSTIGLEASLLGVPVLCGGKARFTQLPTVFLPQSPQAYRRQAEEFLAAEKVEQPPDFKRNARRFLYYQIFRTSLPFEAYLGEDPVWKGYVTLNPLDWKDLLPQNSPTLRAVYDGLINHGTFLLEE